MKLDAKVKGGLAWAGLFVILAVPAANVMFGSADATSGTTAAVATPSKPALTLPTLNKGTDPVTTASTESAPVDKFLQTGKKLPSYISDADEVQAAAAKPAAPVTTPAVTAPKAPTAVATVAPTVTTTTPPIPLPRSARPAPTAVASLPAAPAPQQQAPLIVDETRLNQQQAATERFPLSDEQPGYVSGDQLDEWDSGSLAEYLERRGMLSDSPQQASQEEYYYEDQRPVDRRRLDEFLLF